MLIVVELAGCLVGVVVVEHRHRDRSRLSLDITNPTGTTAGGPQVVPAADQAFVTGTLTKVVGDDVDGPKIPTPFTLTVPERGGGTKAEFTGGLVQGQAKAVLWDGGRPLPVTGQGALDLGPAHVEIGPSGITWRLDGSLRALDPGRYALGANVAVGQQGLATPQDGVTVVVGPGLQAAVRTSGGVTVTLPPAPLTLTGPGRLVLTGDLRVQTPTATKAAHTVEFGPGAFEFRATPIAGGWRIDHLVVQGAFTVGS